MYFGLWYKGKGEAANLKQRPTDQQLQDAFKKDDVLNLLLAKFVRKHGLKPSYSFDEVDAKAEFGLPAAPPPAPVPPSGNQPVPTPQTRIFLRRSITKLPPGVGKDTAGNDMTKSAKDLVENGALFSYGHQFDPGVDQWTAQGVLALEHYFYWLPFGEPAFATISRLLSFAEFSRIDIGGETSKKESNSLNLGTGIEQNVAWPTFSVFDGSIASVRFVEQTDFDFESQIPTAAFEWMPTSDVLGMGSFNTSCPFVWWKTDVAIHADVGHVASDGEWTVSQQGDTYAHLGPKISVSIMPFPNWIFFRQKPLIITGNFAQYEKLSRDSKEIRIAGANASFYLRPPPDRPNPVFDPAVALTVSFQDYRNAENELEGNVIIVGLGIGF